MKAKIGQIAALFSCSDNTIRYYEKQGLLPAPERSASNYRIYGEKDKDRLRFIVHCRKHEIPIEEIRVLVGLLDDPDRDCTYVHELVHRRLEDVEERMRSLLRLKEDLLALDKACACQRKGHCSILRALGRPDGCATCRHIEEEQKKAEKQKS